MSEVMTVGEFKDMLTSLKFNELKTVLDECNLSGIHKAGKKKDLIINEAIAAYQKVLNTVEEVAEEVNEQAAEDKSDVAAQEEAEEVDPVPDPEEVIDLDFEDIAPPVKGNSKEIDVLLHKVKRATANFQNSPNPIVKTLIANNLEKYSQELKELGYKE